MKNTWTFKLGVPNISLLFIQGIRYFVIKTWSLEAWFQYILSVPVSMYKQSIETHENSWHGCGKYYNVFKHQFTRFDILEL